MDDFRKYATKHLGMNGMVLDEMCIRDSPKRRQSKTRTAKRRTHDKAVAPTLAICPNCGEWHVYHTVCGACGYYRGKLAIEKEAAV